MYREAVEEDQTVVWHVRLECAGHELLLQALRHLHAVALPSLRPKQGHAVLLRVPPILLDVRVPDEDCAGVLGAYLIKREDALNAVGINIHELITMQPRRSLAPALRVVQLHAVHADRQILGPIDERKDVAQPRMHPYGPREVAVRKPPLPGDAPGVPGKPPGCRVVALQVRHDVRHLPPEGGLKLLEVRHREDVFQDTEAMLPQVLGPV
mmetsp:Transcript_105305/g.280385  ORF Transcript_105305/g.280385 Transcript_105305/m.280385 type:complete len:210 (-) Transcript_105305:123-752(-)